jgi:ribosomal protein L12E/L44/L45/RPP1/RPP2
MAFDREFAAKICNVTALCELSALVEVELDVEALDAALLELEDDDVLELLWQPTNAKAATIAAHASAATISFVRFFMDSLPLMIELSTIREK